MQRFQKGSLKKRGKAWVGQWRVGRKHFKRVLGYIKEMSKAEAQKALAEILVPINNREAPPSESYRFGDFTKRIYLPFYERKWKRSTAMSNRYRIEYHLISKFDSLPLGTFTRDQLQDSLDRSAAAGLSFSTVDHLRWDLKQIFEMAVAEGFLVRNPAQLLFTPRECPKATTRVMSWDETRRCFSVIITPRERLICGLAVIAGMRPGEIFALTWKRLEGLEYADVQQRIYGSDIDSPKSTYSRRWAALSDGLLEAVREWRELAVDPRPEAWVFPSEKLTTPLRKDNVWRRHFAPPLKAAGLAWVNFQVMRRTHSSLLKELDVDPHVRAEQMGHTVDVNENVYTRTSLQRRRDAVNKLEKALTVN